MMVATHNNSDLLEEGTSAVQNPGHEPLTSLFFSIFTHTALYYVGVFMPLGLLFNALILLVLASPGGRSYSEAPVASHVRRENAPQISENEGRMEASRPGGKIVGLTPSARVYYSAIAIGEFGTMFFKDLWWMWLGMGWPGVLQLNPLGPINPADMRSPVWLCPLILYTWFVHETVANNAFVLFQMERVVALYFPLRARKFLTSQQALKARLCVLVVTALSLVLLGTMFGFDRTQPLGLLSPSYSRLGIKADTDLMPVVGAQCILTGGTIWSSLSIITFLINYTFPAALSIICNCLIAAKIMHRNRNLSNQFAPGKGQMSSSEISVNLCCSKKYGLYLINSFNFA